MNNLHYTNLFIDTSKSALLLSVSDVTLYFFPVSLDILMHTRQRRQNRKQAEVHNNNWYQTKNMGCWCIFIISRTDGNTRRKTALSTGHRGEANSMPRALIHAWQVWVYLTSMRVCMDSLSLFWLYHLEQTFLRIYPQIRLDR